MFLSASPTYLLIHVLSIFCGAQAISHGYLERVDQLNNSAPLAPFRLNNATNDTVANYETSTSEPPSAIPPIPAAYLALLPTVHWDHDAGNIHNLAPQSSHEFYYATGGVNGGSCLDNSIITYSRDFLDPSVEHAFAQISSNMSHPCVVLDHSDHVQSVTHGRQGLRIEFANSQAFEYASSSWSAMPSFIIATNTDGVGATNDQRSFWPVSSFKSQGSENCITAEVHDELPIGEVMEEVAIVWGSYKPVQDTKPSGSESSASATGGSSKPTDGFHPYGAAGDSLGSNGHLNDSTCGQPPSSEIDGFPTGVCGSLTFDKDLDDKVGYRDLEDVGDESDLQSFAPGLEDFATSDKDGLRRTRRSQRHRRALPRFMTRIGNVSAVHINTWQMLI